MLLILPLVRFTFWYMENGNAPYQWWQIYLCEIHYSSTKADVLNYSYFSLMNITYHFFWFWHQFIVSCVYSADALYIKWCFIWVFKWIWILSYYVSETYCYQPSTNSDLFIDQYKWHEVSEVLTYLFLQNHFIYSIDAE